MYVCNCNGITEREVDAAVGAGVDHWEDIHKLYGFEPCCGKCEGEMRTAIARHSIEDAAADDGFASLPALAGAT